MMMRDILTTLLVNAAIFVFLFAILLGARKAMGKRISAVMQYALWAFVVIKLMIPFGFESSLSPLSLLDVSDNTAVSDTQTASADTYLQNTDTGILSAEEASGVQDTVTEQAPQISAADASGYTAQNLGNTDSSVKTEINWTVLIFILWALGALVTAALAVLDAAKLKRKMLSRRQMVSMRIARIFCECRKELRLRKNVDLIVQSDNSVPFAINVFCPKVVLPGDIEEQSDEQIRYILMHELTHIRYGDMFIIASLNILSAIYWFNPFVWICFRLIRKDMETACDCRVLGKLGRHSRREYISTVLQFANRNEGRRQCAAIGMADGRMTMEQRIHGMFKTTKTGVKGRIITAFVAILIMAVSVLSACQPTPEEAIVVGKDSENMLDMAQQSDATADTETAIKEAMDIPDRYTCDLQSESGLVTLAADTQITVPEVPTMPVTRVKMRSFTQEETDRLIEVLMRGNPIYETPERTVFTKEQLNERLIETRRMLASGDYDAGLTRENIEEKISWYEERIPDAPETLADANLTPADGRLTDNDEGDEYLSVLANLGHAYFAHLRVTNDLAYNQVEAYFSSGWNWDGQPKAAALDLTQQEAQQEAEAFLAEMGHEDMSLINCYKDSATAPAHETWVLDYAPRLSGISVSTEIDYSNTMTSADGEEAQAYAPTWEAERLRITIDDEGIQDIQWCSPYDIVEEVIASASLKPFEEIKARFEEMFFVKNSDAVLFDKGKTYDVRFVVDSVKLGLMRVNEKDSPDTGLIVPVWFFHGYEANMLEAELEARGLTEMPDNAGMVLMKINAIDGSIIE